MSVAGRTRVLLVEDHAVNQKVVRRMLEHLGCLVDVADDGEVGVERAKLLPDLVFMDCSMPRMDGFEATRLIRLLPGSAAKVPIVALTAHALPQDRERCQMAGMDGWLAKPVSQEGLAGALREHTSWTRVPAASPFADGILDPRVVESLASLAGPDDPGFFASLVDEFRHTARAAVVEARELCRGSRVIELKRTVHRLKSASATIGAVRLREACARLEAATPEDVLTHGDTWLDLADHEVGLAVVALGSMPGGLP